MTRASTRTRLSVVPVFIALIFNLMAPLLPTAASPTLALTGSSFDALDGNMVAAAGETDWCSPGLVVTRKDDIPTGQTDDSYAEGAKENDLNPAVETGSIPNNKVDLERTYISSETNADGDLFVYVAWVRNDTTGTGTVSFELNQSDVTLSNGVNRQRTAGDLLIEFDFKANPGSQGGYDVTLTYRTWTGTAWSEPASLENLADGSVNELASIVDCLNNNQTLGVAQFGEFALNLTDLLGGDCRAFVSLFAKSRASTQITSTLKDLIKPAAVDFNTCAAILWDKDDQYGNPVAGATFRVTPNPFDAAHTGFLDVLDNTGQAGYTGADVDADGGEFRLEGVEPFTTPGYTVCEWAAPSSVYVVNQTDCVTFAVGASATVDFGTFINVLLEPDVIISKAAPTAAVDAGTAYNYVLTATNQGTLAAENVTVTDDLDDSLTINSVTPSQGSCAPAPYAGNAISCNLGTLAANGGSATVTINVTPTADSCPSVNNQGHVTASNEPTRHQGNNSSLPVTVNILCALIDVDKTPDNGVVDAPGTATFGIVTTNAGDGSAAGAALFDDLPEVAGGWDIVANPGVNDVAWAACAISDEDHPTLGDIGEWLSCGPETIAAGASRTVTVSAVVTTDDCGVLDNQDATASTTNDGTDTDDGLITVRCPELGIQKSTTTPTVTAGDPVAYTVAVTNAGDGAANDVTITDTLPGGVAWSETSPDCAILLTTLTCGPMTVAAGATFSVTVTGNVDADECPSIENSASFTSSNAGSGSTSEVPTAITVNCPDLELVKSGSSLVVAGEDVEFTIGVENIGDGVAYDVLMADDLPELATGTWAIVATVPADLAGCEVVDLPDDDPNQETVLRCSLDELANGDGFSVTVRGTSDVGDCGELINDARVGASNEGSDVLGDNDDDHTIVVNCPDTAVTKSAGDPVDAGETATFQIVVTAGGSGTNEDVMLTDELIGSVDDWSFDVTGAEDSACGITDDAELGTLLSCDFGHLEPGTIITIALAYETDAADCPEVGNSATVTATDDVDVANNASDLVTLDVNCPDLVVIKEQVDESGEPTDEPVTAGDPAYFAVHVINVGPGTAFDVELFDEPAGGTWTVVDGGGFTCPEQIGPNGANCTAEVLEPGTYTVLLSYDTNVPDCGLLVNAVDVSAGNEPGAWVNDENSDTASIIVECPGLNIIKRQVDENGDPTTDPILAGEVAYFEILVWNSDDEGIGTAHDVIVTERAEDLPDGVSWSIDAPDGVSCASSVGSDQPQSFSCDLGDLEPGGSVSIIVSGLTDRADCGALVNTARVDAANNDDEVPAAVATILVSCPEISIDKENDAVGSVRPGMTVGYTLTLTVNDEGLENGEATDVTVIDVMPVGLESPTNISDGGTFDAATRTITWELGNLGEGTYELTYDATVADDVENGEELVNAAAATSSNSQCPDLEELGPECTDDSTVIVRSPSLVIDKVADAEVITISGPAGALVADPAIVTWTLSYTLANGPVTNAVITDEIPAGFVFLDASDGGRLVDGEVTWTFATLSESGSVTFRTTVDPETISRVAPTVNVAVIDSDETEPDEGQDSVTVTVEPPVLGGNPTPKPKPVLPDTATGFGMDGEPMSVPVELLVAFFIGSLGAATLANVKARSRRR